MSRVSGERAGQGAVGAPALARGEGVRFRVCLGTGGVAAGALDVMEALRAELHQHGLCGEVGGRSCRCEVERAGCLGFCGKDVLVELHQGEQRWTYEHVTPARVRRIVAEHLLLGQPVTEWLSGEEYEAYHAGQQPLLLGVCAAVDPEQLASYQGVGGYRAAERVVGRLEPAELVALMERSGLRGRGGGGFPTGVKWKLALAQEGPKVLICNADEGDPGAFMDRALLEGTPHSVIEGMLLAAWAIGAERGIVYVRAEYPLAYRRLRLALHQAREAGYLGADLLGRGVAFEIEVKLGAGAFVCGEETALIASLEDRTGTPRPKPPFPVVSGLRGRPTVINNVETLATVPLIVDRGAQWFRGIGTPGSPGTKIFSLVGKVARTGLVEVPMGTPLRTIVEQIGGGAAGGKAIKAVQTGGPSGGCIPAALLDTPVDYDRLAELGSIMGSGGMVVMDEETCMVDVARYFLEFCQEESCGQCTPCRDGTAQMVRILEQICAGEGRMEQIATLERLARAMGKASLCGLGKTAANPVLSTLRYFREEYEAHILEHRCPAGVCRALISFRIDPQTCTGCTLCAAACPEKAVSGVKKAPHVIDPARCTRCGICHDVCREGAVVKE